MKILISPAKKMNIDSDGLQGVSVPYFIEKAEFLRNILKSMSYEELKKLWKCNDKIAALNFERLKNMDSKNALTPAILSYDGIQYKYIAPNVFTYDQLNYINEHLIILSGLYGMLRPFDGVIPYRLEMQAKLSGENFKSLYDFWGSSVADILSKETDTIINLASKEYSKVVSDNIGNNINFITCSFAQIINGKPVEKGTLCKMARGEMVRYMAENNVKDYKNIKNFNRMNFSYSDALSNESTFVFIKSN
ncbi:MAG: peroxide stress protein YaaA [Clostridiales bacterium]|nr:MAG: peroxide stress protein YaaA [Clostridiales bacterium]